jgi:hypothetical protein
MSTHPLITFSKISMLSQELRPSHQWQISKMISSWNTVTQITRTWMMTLSGREAINWMESIVTTLTLLIKTIRRSIVTRPLGRKECSVEGLRVSDREKSRSVTLYHVLKAQMDPLHRTTKCLDSTCQTETVQWIRRSRMMVQLLTDTPT